MSPSCFPASSPTHCGMMMSFTSLSSSLRSVGATGAEGVSAPSAVLEVGGGGDDPADAEEVRGSVEGWLGCATVEAVPSIPRPTDGVSDGLLDWGSSGSSTLITSGAFRDWWCTVRAAGIPSADHRWARKTTVLSTAAGCSTPALSTSLGRAYSSSKNFARGTSERSSPQNARPHRTAVRLSTASSRGSGPSASSHHDPPTGSVCPSFSATSTDSPSIPIRYFVFAGTLLITITLTLCLTFSLSKVRGFSNSATNSLGCGTTARAKPAGGGATPHPVLHTLTRVRCAETCMLLYRSCRSGTSSSANPTGKGVILTPLRNPSIAGPRGTTGRPSLACE
eukprot:RCo022912